MAKFKVLFQREVTVSDELERIIEAPNAATAEAMAAEMTTEFDMSCPDDVQQVAGYSEIGDWQIMLVTPANKNLGEQ